MAHWRAIPFETAKPKGTKMNDTTAPARPDTAYMREVKSCARDRKRTFYVYEIDGRWRSTIHLTMVPAGSFWRVTPEGTAAPFA
jgi:hypothetical protein